MVVGVGVVGVVAVEDVGGGVGAQVDGGSGTGDGVVGRAGELVAGVLCHEAGGDGFAHVILAEAGNGYPVELVVVVPIEAFKLLHRQTFDGFADVGTLFGGGGVEHTVVNEHAVEGEVELVHCAGGGEVGEFVGFDDEGHFIAGTGELGRRDVAAEGIDGLVGIGDANELRAVGTEHVVAGGSGAGCERAGEVSIGGGCTGDDAVVTVIIDDHAVGVVEDERHAGGSGVNHLGGDCRGGVAVDGQHQRTFGQHLLPHFKRQAHHLTLCSIFDSKMHSVCLERAGVLEVHLVVEIQTRGHTVVRHQVGLGSHQNLTDGSTFSRREHIIIQRHSGQRKVYIQLLRRDNLRSVMRAEVCVFSVG